MSAHSRYLDIGLAPVKNVGSMITLLCVALDTEL